MPDNPAVARTPYPIDNAPFLQELIGPLGGPDDNVWVCGFNEPPTTQSPWRGSLISPGGARVLNTQFNTYYSTALFPNLARGRTLENAISPFVVVVDDAGSSALAPSYTLRTSPNKVQIGYALRERCAPDDLTPLMRWFSAQGRIDGDPSGNNAVRYVRLPRGRNWKHMPPFECVLEQWNPERRYTLPEICAAFGFDPNAPVVRAVGARPADDGEVVLEGGRDHFLTREAGRLRRLGLSAEAIEAALGVINAQRCSPPVDDRDVRRIARSVARYAPAVPAPPPRDINPVTGEVTDALPNDSFGDLQNKCQTTSGGDKALANYYNAILAVEHVVGRRGITFYWSSYYGRGFVKKGERARDVEDADYLKMLHYVQALGWGFEKAKKTDVSDALDLVMQRNARDEIIDYLTPLPTVWDEIERLPTLCEDAFGVTRTPMAVRMFMNLLVGCVARQFVPGSKFDLALVLCGPQGIGKSRALAALFGAENVCSLPHDPASKDSAMRMRGKLCVEMSELVALRRSDVEGIKDWLSTSVDEFRTPYGRVVGRYPRRYVVVGTTNEPEFLADTTGNRRFVPVECGEINVDYLLATRDQLFAEAIRLYRAGFRFWELPEEEHQAWAAARVNSDPWDALVASWLAGRIEARPDDCLAHLVDDVAMRDAVKLKRVQACFRKAGWRTTVVWRDGKVVRRWLPALVLTPNEPI